MLDEKKQVALVSVFAAIFLTSSKLIIGILTGSLGILSEALHSGLDLVAAIITFMAVKISSHPSDADHHYGHGKIENFSALIETVLLLITCAWIMYEATHRLMSGKVEIEVTYFSFMVVIASIIVDVWRSRKLSAAAKKYNSQALEADALHFSTDIWSSAVVLLGLICVTIGKTTGLTLLYYADAVAALCVAVIVIFVAYSLGKQSIDTLLDKAPEKETKAIAKLIQSFPDILKYHDLRVRQSGSQFLIETTIHVSKNLTIEQAHEISDKLEQRIIAYNEFAVVSVHIEPDNHK